MINQFELEFHIPELHNTRKKKPRTNIFGKRIYMIVVAEPNQEECETTEANEKFLERKKRKRRKKKRKIKLQRKNKKLNKLLKAN